jgi:hypothetical protein
MRFMTLLTVFITLAVAGCSGQKSAEGNVKIDSTEPFKKLGSTKSPPPQKPKG